MTIDWETHYGAGPVWSGRVNGTFAAEVAAMTPGRALDVGCGEGADAIWLAQRGWQVTAIDVALAALDRGRQLAELAGVAVQWVRGDVWRTRFPAGAFDLVSLQYPALAKRADWEAGVDALLATLAPGGVLLAVFHHLVDPAHAHAHDVDRDASVSVDDLRARVTRRLSVEVHEVRPRRDPPPGAAHVDDVVLRARAVG